MVKIKTTNGEYPIVAVKTIAIQTKAGVGSYLLNGLTTLRDKKIIGIYVKVSGKSPSGNPIVNSAALDGAYLNLRITEGVERFLDVPVSLLGSIRQPYAQLQMENVNIDESRIAFGDPADLVDGESFVISFLYVPNDCNIEECTNC